jgi:hypothetical protein
MRVAGTAVLVGAGAGLAKAGGKGWLSTIAGAILGGLSPFAESGANAVSGAAMETFGTQNCVSSAGMGFPMVF